MTVEMMLRAMSDRTTCRTRNLADADKPRDAFRGQSRSPNTVPFDMLGMEFLLVFYSNFVPKTYRFEIFDMTLKSELWVTQGHRNRHGSIHHL